jgi:glycerophosphoryl diester phosphodiesterase
MTQVMAHRGASKLEPENTVAAFRRSADLGADAVELDVRRTRDGVLVVHHNPNLVDGTVIAQVNGSQLPAEVPTLTAALDACEGMWVNVEIKNDPSEADFDVTESIADDTIALLRSRHQDHRWLVSSFRIETVDRCRQLSTAIRTAWLTVQVPDDAVDVLLAHGHGALHPWVNSLQHHHIRACHYAGLQVNTWTCDDPLRMAELISWGIDGICTNLPDLALQVRAGER